MYHQSAFAILTAGRFFASTAAAKNSATRLRKKLFCTAGRSPASRTSSAISAKKNAERIM